MPKIPRDGKLIDAGHLYRYADGEYNRVKVKYGADSVQAERAELLRDVIGEMACDLPEQAVLTASWETECRNRYRCSNCGFGRNVGTQSGWKFCPNCGAHTGGLEALVNGRQKAA